ncbi:MIP18 protein galla-2 [Coelomomyces lativittatus]|nr:MIP18 protein galla-2 [Coelomomyces lativittatus]KAJ1504183.1 MIP18 protein galla-2 [Coelomomyces lativittatus]
MTLLNANPTIFESDNSSRINRIQNLDETIVDEFDAQEIFDLIRNINDPEHPLTLEQLNVAQLGLIHVDNIEQTITVKFTPTIPHCSMATLIGLCIRVRLLRCIPPRFKVTVLVSEGSHQSEDAVNKQLKDKERVAAALENINLLELVNQCLANAIVK